MSQIIDIAKDAPLAVGDTVELIFDLIGPHWLWLMAAESALLESRLSEQYPNFQIQSREWADDYSTLTITAKVVTPAEPGVQQAMTGEVIAALILAGMFIAWLSLREVKKIMPEASTPISLLAIAAIMFFAWQILKKGDK